jgi:hypothetical protein
MNNRSEIIIHGRVQKAAYKDFIDEIAFNLNTIYRILMIYLECLCHSYLQMHRYK